MYGGLSHLSASSALAVLDALAAVVVGASVTELRMSYSSFSTRCCSDLHSTTTNPRRNKDTVCG